MNKHFKNLLFEGEPYALKYSQVIPYKLERRLSDAYICCFASGHEYFITVPVGQNETEIFFKPQSNLDSLVLDKLFRNNDELFLELWYRIDLVGHNRRHASCESYLRVSVKEHCAYLVPEFDIDNMLFEFFLFRQDLFGELVSYIKKLEKKEFFRHD